MSVLLASIFTTQFIIAQDVKKHTKKLVKVTILLKNKKLKKKQIYNSKNLFFAQIKFIMVKSGEKWSESWWACMLMGEFQHNIDDKGRLFMPAKLRDDLGTHFIVTKGLDGCLFVYTEVEWNKLQAKFADSPMSNQNVRAVARFFFGGAVDAEPDKQGRIMLPQSLRIHACLKKVAVILGVGSRAEIWDIDKWNEYNDKVGKDVNDIVGQLVDLGI
jgi:mraZ protein